MDVMNCSVSAAQLWPFSALNTSMAEMAINDGANGGTVRRPVQHFQVSIEDDGSPRSSISSFTHGISGDSGGTATSMPTPRWFSDPRTQFTNATSRLLINCHQIIADLNTTARQNPELVSNLRSQLESLSGLITNFQRTQRQNDNDGVIGAGTDSQQNSDEAMTTRHEEVENELANSDIPPITNINDGATASRDEHRQQQPPIQPNIGAGLVTVATDDAVNQVTIDIQRIINLVRAPEGQFVLRAFLGFVPFLLIYAAKFLIDHFDILFSIITGVALFVLADNELRHAFATRRPSNTIRAALICFGWLSFHHLWLYWKQKPWQTLSFGITDYWLNHADLCTTIWLLLFSDLTLKFATIITKLLIVLAPMCGSIFGMKRKRRLMQWIEYSSQIYRYCVPIPIIYRFLLMTHKNASDVAEESFSFQGFASLFCAILAVLYVAIKFWQMRPLFLTWLRNSMSLLCMSSYGRPPSYAELKGNGGCPICFMDLQGPIKLNCGHIFCDDCICTWLDKERTCPMCRKVVVKNDNHWKDGSSSLWFYLY